MRIAFVLCLMCFALVGARSQTVSAARLDSLIARYDRGEIACQAAVDSFTQYYGAHPRSGLAALYVARAYGWYGSIGSGCTGMDARASLAATDSELAYLSIANRLGPGLRDRRLQLSPLQLIGHAYGGRALWHLFLRDTARVINDLKLAKQTGGYSDALIEYSRLVLNALPKNAIMFSFGDDDLFPMWYLQLVEGKRRDLLMVNSPLLCMGWYQQLLAKGIAGFMTPLDFVPTPGTNDTTEIPPELYDKMYHVGGSRSPARFPIAPSVRGTIADELGHDPPDTLVTSGFNAAAGHDFEVSSYLMQRILRSNEWVRPVYIASSDYRSIFQGIEPYLRIEGFVSRVLPDTGDKYDENIHAWVDSSRFELAIRQAIDFVPRSDSETRLVLNIQFLNDGLLAYYYQVDSTRRDELIDMLRPIVRSEPLHAFSRYAQIAVYLYGAGHTQFRGDVEWISTSLKTMIESQTHDMGLVRFYAETLSVLHKCIELQTFFDGLDTTYSSSDDQSNYTEIGKLVQACK